MALTSDKIIFFLEKVEIVRRKKLLKNKLFKITTCEVFLKCRSSPKSGTKISTTSHTKKNIENGDEDILDIHFNEELSLDMRSCLTHMDVVVRGKKGCTGGVFKDIATLRLEIADLPFQKPDKTETRNIKDIKSEAASEVRLVYKAHREQTQVSLEARLEKEGFQGFTIVPEGPEDETTFTTPGMQSNSTSPRESSMTAQRNNSHSSPSDSKKWQKDSCILVMGSVKAGKTTTINLYTGNSASTGHENRRNAETEEIIFFEDVHHEVPPATCCSATQKGHPYPVWMDIPGFDEWREGDRARNDDEELEREILIRLKERNIRCLEAIVWNIRAGCDVKTPQLVKEAKFIHDKLGKGKKSIWKNVVVVIRMLVAEEHEVNVEGAKAAIEEVTGGDPTIHCDMSFLQYKLEKDATSDNSGVSTFTKESIERGRQELDKAFGKMKGGVPLKFDDKICKDCGLRGDERVLSAMCHDQVNIKRQKILGCIPGMTNMIGSQSSLFNFLT